jgi:Protein of unknown function (DUF1217)
VSYQPVVPLPGIAGWRFLERTQGKQQAAFENGAELKREIAYFEANIASVKTAADLVADRRLLKVALAAFGLDGEIDKKAFIRKVLEEGTIAEDALATRLTDPAWRRFSAAFGFGDGGAKTGAAGFAAGIVAAYKTRAFEAAVGQADNNMRLALNFRREIAALAAGEGGSWYTVLGSRPLRQVFEKAFGLPAAFGQIDIDKQAEVMRDRTDRLFGSDSLAAFQDQAAVDKLIDRFLARAQIEEGAVATGPAAAALTLLQSMQSGGASSGLQNLFASLG